MAIETAIKEGTCYIVVLFAVALAAAEAIRSEKLPNGGVQLAIEMSSDGGAFVYRRRLFCLA
jgi:hypothetical protein